MWSSWGLKAEKQKSSETEKQRAGSMSPPFCCAQLLECERNIQRPGQRAKMAILKALARGCIEQRIRGEFRN
jgi:hypothetical protein